MYAVIETGGKQYRVEFGTEIEVEHLEVDAGQTIDLDRILLVADGDQATIGSPLVDGALVRADVVRQDRGEKLIVFKYKPKARRRVKKGHRQELTVLRISEISLGGRSAAEDAAKVRSEERRARKQRDEEASRQAAADQALAAKLAAEAEAQARAEAEAEAKAAPRKGRSRVARTGSATASTSGAPIETAEPVAADGARPDSEAAPADSEAAPADSEAAPADSEASPGEAEPAPGGAEPATDEGVGDSAPATPDEIRKDE